MTTVFHAALTRLFVAIADACDRVSAATRVVRRWAIVEAVRHSAARWRAEGEQ